MTTPPRCDWCGLLFLCDHGCCSSWVSDSLALWLSESHSRQSWPVPPSWMLCGWLQRRLSHDWLLVPCHWLGVGLRASNVDCNQLICWPVANHWVMIHVRVVLIILFVSKCIQSDTGNKLWLCLNHILGTTSTIIIIMSIFATETQLHKSYSIDDSIQIIDNLNGQLANPEWLIADNTWPWSIVTWSIVNCAIFFFAYARIKLMSW